MGHLFSLDYFFYFFPRVLSALPVTLLIVVLASLIGSVLGLLIAIIRVEKVPVLSPMLALAVSYLKGTPLLVQLFIVYFGIPILLKNLGLFGFQVDGMVSVYIAYGLNVGAFLSELFRSAILAVPKGQIEAGQSVGLTSWQIYKRIIFPQARFIALPGYGSTLVSLLQNTSMAFTIGVIEMLGKVRALQTVVFRSLEGYVSAAIIFIALSIAIDQLFKYLEDQLSFSSKQKLAHKGGQSWTSSKS